MIHCTLQVGGELQQTNPQRIIKLHQLGGEIDADFPLVLGLVSWRHQVNIITKCRSVDEAIFYLKECVLNGWSRQTLDNSLKANLYKNHGNAISNFPQYLPEAQSRMAQEITKDNYDFGFVTVPADYKEEQLEVALEQNITRFLLELGSESEVDNYLVLFPELNSRLSKFAVGILKWNIAGLIDINNPDDVSRVRLILKVIDQTPGFDFFDNTFNECDPETVCEIIGMSPMAPVEEPVIEFNYTVDYIGSYADARQYLDMTSWCIVISEESFKAYTANGNRFYFCGNGEWWNVPCIPGNGFPRDRFGYSLIAVEVTPENQIASITSRWNTCAGDTGDFITVNELKSILGTENYDKLLCKPAENH